MSAIAEFYKLDKAHIEELKSASVPVKRFLRKPEDRYFEFLEQHARRLREYEGSGFVYGALLPYLGERGINLTESEFDELGAALTQARGATHFVFTQQHRDKYLDALQASKFDDQDLRAYYEEFMGEAPPEVGQALVTAIAVLRENLEAVDENSIVVLAIF